MSSSMNTHTNMEQQYDYIVTGGGAAGLSFVVQLLDSPLRHSRVLVLDKAPKTANDRTWCFWEDAPGPFESIVYRRWQQLSVHTLARSHRFGIAPFTYKMIRGIDFYEYAHQRIAQAPQVTVHHAAVERIDSDEQGVTVTAGGQQYRASYCFNSIPRQPIDKTSTSYVDQHFKGWVIQTPADCFVPDEAVLMDFRTPQLGEARFLYVLPIDARQALVELAIFSNELLPQSGYDDILRQYISEYIPAAGDYQVAHEEFGIIPMTDFRFPRREGRTLNIGTAGGDTKASTGYTFWNIQQHTAHIIHSLQHQGHPFVEIPAIRQRFRFYDSTLLHIIQHNHTPSDELFMALFTKNPPQRVLRFLNEMTHLPEELALMTTVPIPPFLRSFLRALWRG